MRQIFALFLVIAAISIPLSSNAQNLVLQQATLENGLQLVVVPNHRMPILTHMVFYKVGAMDEINGKSGLAHFLEHLMFKGTPNVPAGEFSKRIADIGGNENAMTTSDYTAYFQTIAKEHLPLVMELEADRMQNLSMSEKDFNSEKSVILEERRSRVGNDPGAILSEEMMAAHYRNHPYGRPLIGWEHEIEDLTHQDVMDFHARYYAPNNAIVVVAGDADIADVKPLAEKFYGSIPSKTIDRAVEPQEPAGHASRSLVYRSNKVRQPQYIKYISVPGFYTSPDHRNIVFGLEVLDQILSGPSGILYKDLVVGKKLAVGVNAYYDPDKRGPTNFVLGATPAEKTSQSDLVSAIDADIRNFIKTGVQDADLVRAKKSLLAEAIYARDNNYRMAYVVGEALALGGTLQDIEDWEKNIDAVSKDDVMIAARLLVYEEGATSGWLLPPGE
ncbi:MAG: insulinase family protein [Alphaproteobacteria bacterium]|nr:MAG: insulinase family protein [Alphaproteobacteria bacterium]